MLCHKYELSERRRINKVMQKTEDQTENTQCSGGNKSKYIRNHMGYICEVKDSNFQMGL